MGPFIHSGLSIVACVQFPVFWQYMLVRPIQNPAGCEDMLYVKLLNN